MPPNPKMVRRLDWKMDIPSPPPSPIPNANQVISQTHFRHPPHLLHLASPLLQHAVWQIHAGEKSKKGIKFNLKTLAAFGSPDLFFDLIIRERGSHPLIWQMAREEEEEEKSNGFCFCNTTQRDPWTYTRLTWERERERGTFCKVGRGCCMVGNNSISGGGVGTKSAPERKKN